MKVSYYCERCTTLSRLFRLYLRRKSANENREFKAIGWYCYNCKWFLTDEAFSRRPKVPNQKEQLSQIRAISREVKEIQNDFHRKWGIRLSKQIGGFGSFV